jgi:hypothetical protein
MEWSVGVEAGFGSMHMHMHVSDNHNVRLFADDVALLLDDVASVEHKAGHDMR